MKNICREDDFDIITGAGGGNRTRTGNTTHKILSLGRLPIPTHRHNLSPFLPIKIVRGKRIERRVL